MILSVTSLGLNRAVSYIFRAWAINKLLKTLVTEYWPGGDFGDESVQTVVSIPTLPFVLRSPTNGLRVVRQPPKLRHPERIWPKVAPPQQDHELATECNTIKHGPTLWWSNLLPRS